MYARGLVRVRAHNYRKLLQAAERDPSGFVREMVITTASDEAQAAYAEAQSRARDIEALIRSINEVAVMFQDLASLVQHQTELLDNIGACVRPPPLLLACVRSWHGRTSFPRVWACAAENNVDTAVTYMKKGNTAVRVQ